MREWVCITGEMMPTEKSKLLREKSAHVPFFSHKSNSDKNGINTVTAVSGRRLNTWAKGCPVPSLATTSTEFWQSYSTKHEQKHKICKQLDGSIRNLSSWRMHDLKESAGKLYATNFVTLRNVIQDVIFSQ